MKPTYAEKVFTAQRLFTGRDEERAVFTNALTEAQGADEYRVVSWYGIGGQGKSALSRELVRIATKQEEQVAVARVDFDDKRMRRIDECLLSIRLQLSQTYGHHFGAFDTAFARYFVMTNPGLDIREKHPELFRGENPLLDDLIDWSEAGLEVVVEGAALTIPGLNLVYKYGSRFAVRTREWFERRGKTTLAGLDQLGAEELLARLPSYLGNDLRELKKIQAEKRSVVIVDTHEALWRDYNVKDPVEGARVEDWLRLFVQDSPGTLIAVLGRDRLQWNTIDPDWVDIVESHLLEGLPPQDADHFLRAVPIDDETIRNAIIDGAEGLPFFLDLQVDIYERLIESGEKVEPHLFGDSHPDILKRFLDHIGGDEQKLLRIASYPQGLTESLMNNLAERFLGGIGHLNWRRLLQYSFMTVDASGTTMHSLMREALQQREEEERYQTFTRVHEWLFDQFSQLAEVQFPSEIRSTNETAFFDALYHAKLALPGYWERWFNDAIDPFEKAHRSVFLENIYRLVLNWLVGDLGDVHPDTLTMRHRLAYQVGKQGRYNEAAEAFHDIWELQRRPDVLGEDHPDTLMTRHHHAQQVGRVGHHKEAEVLFRTIWKVQRRSNVLGEEHPDTLMTRHNLAYQLSQQGRYMEAEAAFRAIWEIQRRPSVLGEEHPHTLTTRNNVALQMSRQGAHEEAEKEFRVVWETRRLPNVLGENHPRTLTTRHNLAYQLAQLGRCGEAEAEYRAIWEIQRRPDVLGEEHPNNLRLKFHLAIALDLQQRDAEATTLLADLDSQYSEYFAENHLWRKELRNYLVAREI